LLQKFAEIVDPRGTWKHVEGYPFDSLAQPSSLTKRTDLEQRLDDFDRDWAQTLVRAKCLLEAASQIGAELGSWNFSQEEAPQIDPLVLVVHDARTRTEAEPFRVDGNTIDGD